MKFQYHAWIYRVSKWVHKYTGLVLSLFILWMAASGILLNHPSLIEKWSVPMGLMPDQYGFENWNRYSFRDGAVSEKDPGHIFIGGKLGVWQSRDSGKTFVPMGNGFPESAWQKDTFSLLPVETGSGRRLFAGTRSGVYVADIESGTWRHLAFDTGAEQKVVSLVRAGSGLMAFTPSACFYMDLEKNTPFRQVRLPPPAHPTEDRSTAGFLLDIHDGSILGQTGKLGVDLLALILIFLSISGIVIWVGPARLKQTMHKRMGLKTYKLCYRYHLKFGIWAAVFLVIVTATGILVKPPFIRWVYRQVGPVIQIPSVDQTAPWKDQIYKAVFLEDEKRILLSTRTGFYKTPTSLDRPFVKEPVSVPVSGMGTTVLKPLAGGRLLVGSFKGLYSFHPRGGSVTPWHPGGGNPKGKTAFMVSGALVTNGKLQGAVCYRNGWTPVSGGFGNRLMQPDISAGAHTVPLWFFLFELHNARIFKGLAGSSTWMILPVGGTLLLLLILTGCYDWIVKKSPRPRKKR